METLVEMIKNLKIEFDKEQQWNRYVDGDILYDVTDEKSANTVYSYVVDPENNLSLEETHKYFEYIMQALTNLSVDAIDKIDNKWLEMAAKNREVFLEAKAKILKRWTGLIFEKCGAESTKNEVFYQLENLTLSFWRASAERKGKIIFFPGIHIEIVPFLQSIRVVQNYEQYTNELHDVLKKYPLEFLYLYVEPEEEPEPYDEQVPEIFVENKKATKKKMKKKSSKKGLTNTIELALKSGEKRKKKQAHLSQRTLLSRSPSLKRGEHIRFNLYSDVTPIWKKSAGKERSNEGTEHKIDFGTEAFLGPIYHISSFESERKSQKYGSWSITLDANLEERKLNGESILVSLKVPVEEVFLGSNEPVVAFRDDTSTDWKKGVFTTHTQFDQNTFIVTTRLSKMGFVSLFQHNDFHYPYKSWQIVFDKDKISLKLHTNVVELAFVIEGYYFYLDTLTGDEFSKLRNLHQKRMSLSELMMKLERHGVHIIPNSDTINKHRDTKKDLDLEIFTYRIICLNQINCESCRMNSTVSSETVVLTVDGAPRNITTKAPGKYVVNFGICPPVLDIIILFDTSGGNDTVFEQQKNWTIKIVRDLPIHEDAVRVGLVQYSDAAKTEFNLSRYSERNDIITHLETLTFMPGEDTRTGVALDKADEEIFNYTGGARLKATRLIIVFTDGLSMDKPTKSAKTLRRKGVKIYTISVNSIGFVPEMLGIVGDADNVFGPTDEDRIEERLLTEVEHSRSCEVQPKRHEKTTSSFGLRITDFIAINPENSEVDFSNTTTIPITTSESFARDPENSEEADGDNNVEDIGRNETETTLTSVEKIPTTSPVSLSWKEPLQLFTVETESTHENIVLNLTNLKTSLADESNTSEAKDINDTVSDNVSTGQTPDNEVILSTELPTSTAETTNSVEISTSPVEPTTVLTTLPAVTTICINTPTSTVAFSSGLSNLSSSTTKSFLVKLGVEKEKKEKDPVSKFLGRDVSNSNLIKEEKEEDGKEFDSKSFGKNSEESNSSVAVQTSENITTSTQSAATNRFFFSTRVTFRPVSSTTRTSTTSASTYVPSTTSTTPATTATTTGPVATTTTPSLRSSTLKQRTESSTTDTSPSSPVTPPQKSSFLFQTLSAVTAFPTLLSMEKAVTLPINNALGVSKPMKKKIRRIIKRRRNILPSSQAKKVTDKVVEVKRVPTPTTPPIRSTLRPIIIEEKEEEIFSSSVQCPMDILFVVDSSGSIARTYDTQKDYLTQLIKKVEPSRSHRVGLIQFAGPHIQKMEWSFDTHSKNSQLLSAIRSVRHLTGTTYIGAALELSLILLDSRRKHTETTVILISDGFSQDDSTQQAKLLRQLPNVKMYAISLNKLTNTKYLTDIVGDRKNLFINDESHWFEEFFTKKLRCVPTTR